MNLTIEGEEKLRNKNFRRSLSYSMRYRFFPRFRLSTMFVVMTVVALLIAVNLRPTEVPWNSTWDIKSVIVDDEPHKFAVAYGWPWWTEAIYKGEPAKSSDMNWVRARRLSRPRAVYANLVVAVAIVLLSTVISEIIPRWLKRSGPRQNSER